MAKKGKSSQQVSNILFVKIHKAIVGALNESCQLVRDTAWLNCPKGRKWGTNPKEAQKIGTGSGLANSIVWKVNPLELKGSVYTRMKYAPMVEFGVRPHIIRPKDKKALAFGRPIGKTKGGDIMRETVVKEVHHPGTAAQPFLRPSLDSNRENIKRIFAFHINKIK